MANAHQSFMDRAPWWWYQYASSQLRARHLSYYRMMNLYTLLTTHEPANSLILLSPPHTPVTLTKVHRLSVHTLLLQPRVTLPPW